MRNVPDTDMTEADSAASPAPPPAAAAGVAGSSSAQEDFVKLLGIARQLINERKPSQALQVVILLCLSLFLMFCVCVLFGIADNCAIRYGLIHSTYQPFHF